MSSTAARKARIGRVFFVRVWLCAVEGRYVAIFSPVHVRSTLIGEKVFPQEKQRGSMLVESLEFKVERTAKLGKRAMSSSAARKARIGEVPQAEGFNNGLGLRVYG